MDPARQSAVVGAFLGVGVAAIGIVVVAIALGAIETRVHMPRELLALQGAGIVLCGAAFASATFHRRLALSLAFPGAVFGFIVPIAWFALS